MKKWSLLLVVFVLFSFQEPGTDNLTQDPSTKFSAEDKEYLLEYFQRTKEHLEEITEDLSKEQIKYKPAPDRWSVAQVLEHVILTEQALYGSTREMLSNSPNPERKAEVKVADEDLVMGIEDRSTKFKTSAELEPVGKYDSAEVALEEFEERREEIVALIKTTPEAEMRKRISDSPFGAIDAYQSFLFIAGHTARHTKQIEEVLTDPGFPEM